jgi:methyl-accepting chemotaxis protein
MLGFIVLLSLTFGIGGSLLIAASFDDALSRAETRRSIRIAASYNAGRRQQRFVGRRGACGALEQLDRQNSQSWAALRCRTGRTRCFGTGRAELFDRDMLEAVDGTQIVLQVRLGRDGAHLLAIAGRFETKSGPRYLESIYDISSVYTARAAQNDIYRRVFAAVVILGAAISWLMSYWPLGLSPAVRRVAVIASGDLSCRAEADGKDEIDKLAQDFNYMADSLRPISPSSPTPCTPGGFMGGFAHELKTR